MHKIKIFCLVEGKVIDELSDRVSGTFIRIHYILKRLKQHKDIKLIYIPFEYKQKYSDTYSRINCCIDTFYHFAIPFLSLLIIFFRRPHFIYFSYPNVVYNDKYNIYLLRFAKRVGIKLLMYSHDWVEQSEIDGRGENKFLSKELEEELVKISDILLVAFSKYPNKETIVLPGGLEESEFSHLKYKIVKNRFNIGYTGSLHPGKGIDILVNSVVSLHRKYPYVHLYLWGSLPKELDDCIKDIIEKSKYITNEIVPRTQLFKNFHKIDVLAYTYNPRIDYWDKNHPTKFFEYIGSEIPFISTKCKGIKKITGGRGLLFVDYSAEDFSEKLEYLLNTPNERLRLHKELGELKKENTWEKRAEIFHSVLLKDRAPKLKLPNKDTILPCHGLQILVRNPRRSVIGRSIYLKGIYEQEVTHFISSKIKLGMTILDIGADIGYYALLFAKHVGSKGQVYAFEPIPKSKQYLDKNILMNGLNNVRTFGFALFDKSGTVCLEDPFTKSKINPSKKSLSGNDIQVEMKMFDEWKLNEGMDNVDLVKLDVEGAELNVLQGMKDTLQSQHPKILIEVHPQQLKSFGFSPLDVIEFLSKVGYKIEPVDKTKIDFSQGNITLFCQ